MTYYWRSWCWKLGLASLLTIGGTLATSGNCVIAQITPDGTLGAESSVATPDVINGLPSDRIDGGAIRGSNLFHSFEEFNIGEGRGAYFTNPDAIQNILSRVTGNDISNILGTLGVLGNANLFLINPNGINFGENASLNVNGSFVGTTANAIQFANQGFFSASAPDVPPLLTVNPSAFLFNQIATKPITINSGRFRENIDEGGLKVSDGQSLLLLGGDVRLDDAVLPVPGSRVELGGVASLGTVGLNFDSSNLSLSFPDGVARADISIANRSRVNVRAGGGGSIAVNARNLKVLEGSVLRAGIEGNLGSVNSQAGDITLNATETITVAGSDGTIANLIGTGAVGKGGDINIQAGSLSVNDGILRLSTEGEGDGGSLFIRTNGAISFTNSYIYGISSAEGTTGDVNIHAGSSFLSDNTQMQLNSLEGSGKAGNVSVQANGSISFVNNSEINTVSSSLANAGNILVQANDSVSFVNSGFATNAFAQGKAGDISVQANGPVSLVATGLSTTSGNASLYATAQAEGDSGDIYIQAKSLSITEGSNVSARTAEGGRGGNINLNTTDFIEISGRNPSVTREEYAGRALYYSGVLTGSERESTNSGGKLSVTTGSLRISDGGTLSARSGSAYSSGDITVNANVLEITGSGQILTTASISGDAGNINVNVTDRITISGSNPTVADEFNQVAEGIGVDAAFEIIPLVVSANGVPGSGLFTSTSENSTGRGGDLIINTGQLIVRDGAEVNVSSAGAGAAGNLTISADSIGLDNQSSLRATTAAGAQGNITLRSGDLVLRRGSNITTNATETATGGDINIDTGVLAALENSDITANAPKGSGGKIVINAQGVFGTEPRYELTPESDITATGAISGGTITINNPDVDPSQGLVELPAELVDVSNQIAQGCPASVRSGESKFIITGRGGLPPNPNEPLTGEAVITTWATLDSDAENRSDAAPTTNSTNESASAQIVEASGWVVNDKGEVFLTASAPTTLDIPWLRSSNCNNVQ